MPRIRKVSAALMDERQERSATRSPAQLARERRENQFRELLTSIGGPDDVYLVSPSDNEKASTIRLSLQRVARDLDREVIVRKHENGFLVGLSTPERERSRRGRKPSRGADGSAAS